MPFKSHRVLENEMLPLIEMTGTNRIESVKKLIASGCDINEKDEHGNTVLFYAVVFEYYEIAKLLLESGADVNSVDNYGQSALMGAAHVNSLDCVKLLLDYGADVNLKSSSGQTAFDRAKEETLVSKCWFFEYIVARPRRKESEIMKILKKYKKIQDETHRNTN